jgi:DNA (cytosine-5)-methyltransferase 1
MTLTYGSLFSGAGMLDEGVQSVLGGKLSWYAEFDAAASKVMAHHYPGIPNLGDVTKVDWASVPHVDVLTGGSPCQDLSHAGKRAGMTAGTRSNLWVQMREAIAVLRPRLVVWENVRGALSASADSDLEPCPGCVGDPDDGPVLRALGRVLGDLAELGYDARWYGLRAADVGAPHGRFRIFLFAVPADAKSDPWWLSDGDGRAPTDAERGGQHGWTTVASLLPTPTSRDHKGRNQRDDATCLTGALLPTPRATDGTNGGPNQRGSSGDLMLPSAVHLLPTPAVNDMGAGKTVEAWDEWTARMKAKHGNGNGHGSSLAIEAQRAVRWGQYAPAIARWEVILGRPAPAPTETTAKGAQRLWSRFVEWMMGLPAGWVTDLGLTRNEELKILGNGVVRQQAAAATRAWVCDMRAERAA